MAARRGGPAARARGLATDFACIAFLTAFSLVLYSGIFAYDTFGPEFPLFYFYNDGLSFRQMLRSYTYDSLMWYRPTSFALFYWIGEQFIDWHNLAGWKFFHFWTVMAACYAIYWFVLRVLGGNRPAALLSATYFIAQPSLYAFVMEVAPFDFIYILLTVLCAGCYLLAMRARGAGSIVLTGCAWLLCVAALTAKEMALAIPVYLLAAGVIVSFFHRGAEPLRKSLRREILRVLPFFAVLPAYYFFHLAKMPAETFTATGPYRALADWNAIVANFRKFALWIVRIYAYTGEKAGDRMYQSTFLNNAVGAVALVLVVAAWAAMARRDRSCRLPLALMLAWTGVFLAMPVYAGGFIWHINLPVVGYAVLFGIAAGWWLERIPSPAWRTAAAAALFACALLLGRANLRTELYNGTHATGFRINQHLLKEPPVAPERLGKAPLVYVEDRLGIGAWWYGCYGRLFNFAYRRHDIEEVVVPELPSVAEGLRKKWLAHENAWFFRYDGRYRWHDASEEFRGLALRKGVIQPGAACGVPGRQVQFSLATGGAEGRRVRWSVDPAGAGRISASGLYTAPDQPPAEPLVRITAVDAGDPATSASTLLTFGTRAPVRISAGGTQVADASGRIWNGDANYDGGKTYTSGNAIAGTDSPALYQSERFNDGPFAYRFCVANGTYTVRLKFAEIWFTGPGQRVFDVAINGVTVLSRFDIVKEAGGPSRAVDREFRTAVMDGQVVIAFQPVISNPKISAIEITP